MFGYCDMQWQSVISPAMPPRPIVDPLTGGYRRMPVMQLGADIFCDTKLIASEIAAASNKPELAMETCGEEIRQYSDYVDTTVFMAGVQTSSRLNMLLTVFRLFSPRQGLKFIKDRAGIQKTSSVKPLGRKRANKLIDDHYADMQAKLQSRDFLFGNTPSIADFSAYHNLWFRHLTSGTKQLDGLENVNRWYSKMTQLGHGQRSKASRKTAFIAAKEQAPRAIPKRMQRAASIGKKVAVRPSDYAKDAVAGGLVGEDESRWIVARETAKFGTLHVHFPKQGFEIILL